jgi:hypothetical protein
MNSEASRVGFGDHRENRVHTVDVVMLMLGGLALGGCSVVAVGLAFLAKSVSVSGGGGGDNEKSGVSDAASAGDREKGAVGEKAGLLRRSERRQNAKFETENGIDTNKCFDENGFYVYGNEQASEEQSASEASDGGMAPMEEGLSVEERAALRAQSIISQTSPRR